MYGKCKCFFNDAAVAGDGGSCGFVVVVDIVVIVTKCLA